MNKGSDTKRYHKRMEVLKSSLPSMVNHYAITIPTFVSYFILVAIFSFVVAQIVLFFHSEVLTAATFRIPEIWSYSHIIILGFAMMVAMGAMYQLVPVVFLTPIWRQKIGFVHLVLTSFGVMIFFTCDTTKSGHYLFSSY